MNAESMALSQRLFTMRGIPLLALWISRRAQGVNAGRPEPPASVSLCWM